MKQGSGITARNNFDSYFGRVIQKLQTVNFSNIAKYKRPLTIFIIVLFVVIISRHLHENPNVLEVMKHIKPTDIGLILFGYLCFLATGFVIQDASLKLFEKRIGYRDGMLLLIYSTILNFVGPLQSGPGFRAVYLKKKHDFQVRHFVQSILIYYLAFGCTSVAMLLMPLSPLAALAALVILVLCSVLITRRLGVVGRGQYVARIVLFTIVQLVVVWGIYAQELRALNVAVEEVASLAYTGSANLAMFVAITPAAVGFREFFIYVSQTLHGIGTNTIISASLVDRTLYMIVLGALFIVAGSMHLGRRFAFKNTVE